jgi:hypothetical protein
MSVRTFHTQKLINEPVLNLALFQCALREAQVVFKFQEREEEKIKK